MSVDIEIENKEVSVEGQSVDVVGSNEVNVDICKQEDISVSVKKREYVVTSDDIFIGQQGSFLPDPVRSLISETISTTLSGSLVDLSNANGNISAAIQAMTDISNGFESTIISVANDLEGFVNAEINGLNSTYQSTKADVDTIKATYVDGDQALAIATTAINSESGPDGSIRASVLDFMSTYTNQTEANAISIDSIASQITDEDTGLTATATAVTTLNTTVGIDDSGSPTGSGLIKSVESNASAITDIDAYIKDPNTGAYGGADSSVNQEITSQVSSGKLEVESKWEYNSEINIGGVSYASGFGLVHSGTNTDGASGKPSSGSEFWIKADKFKLITTGQSGVAKYPFIVDGISGDITFNGKVTFGSGTSNPDIISTSNSLSDLDANANNLISSSIQPGDNISALTNDSGYQDGSDISNAISNAETSNNDLFAQRLGYNNYADLVNKATLGETIIIGGYINAYLLEANSINADKINATNLSTISADLGTVNAGVMYNSGGGASNYTMKIDLNNGEIHIR